MVRTWATWTPFIQRVRRHLNSGGQIPWVTRPQAHGGAENAATDCLSAFQYAMFGVEMVGVSVGAYDVCWEDDPDFPPFLLVPSVHMRFPWADIPEKYRLGESSPLPVRCERLTRNNEEYYRVYAESAVVLIGQCVTGNEAGLYVIGHWDNGDKTVLFVSGSKGGIHQQGVPFTPNGGPVTFNWGHQNVVLNVKLA